MTSESDTFMLDALLELPPAREFVHYVSLALVTGLLTSLILLTPIYHHHMTLESVLVVEERWVLPRVLQLSLIGSIAALFTLVRPFLPFEGVGSEAPASIMARMPPMVRYNVLTLGSCVVLILVNLIFFEPLAARALFSMRKRAADLQQSTPSTSSSSSSSPPSTDPADVSELASDAAIVAYRFYHGMVIITNIASVICLLAYFSFLAKDTPLPTP